MSKYTTEVRYICESAVGLTESVGFDEIDNVLSDENIPVIMSGIDYPIFDEAYRIPLNRKILMHYYTREIGLETVGLWKLKLRTRLNEIMPYFNKLYRSELIDFNPMYDVDVTTERTGEGTGLTNSSSKTNETEANTNDVNRNNSNVSSSSKQGENLGENKAHGTSVTDGWQGEKQMQMYSDTPQGMLENVEDGTYLTNAQKNTANRSNSDTAITSSDGSSKAKFTEANDESNVGHEKEQGSYNGSKENNTAKHGNTLTTDHYIETVVGKTGGASYSERLEAFRKTFLNIDMLVINSLNDLFFGLW